MESSRPVRSCAIAGGKRRLHTTFPDGLEIVEEYDINSYELLSRRVKKTVELGEGKWELEVGEPPSSFNPESDLMIASSTNPIFIRKDLPTEFQWRIRNLPYPFDVYSVTGDSSTSKITIRTSNKKYFKIFEITDLFRKRLRLIPDLIRYTHQFNTLIITYPKPREILLEEAEMRRQLEEARKTRGNKPPQDGDVECVQQ
ncbi:DPCD [Blepharisma stoltei]|uniref:Protein DPCD n=1 Tax=Blepharisma stoltei TaxID=1481888 RepID=A0AAU9IK72_9CILI|nr:unnamed protein product [Blepharisma stoltei]